MATDFSQDAVLRFLQSSGGSVKNSDLLLHFRSFIRNHEDQDRNRELFKKFVNSVATVRQEDGVSYVVLRKKLRGHIPGDGGGGPPGPPRHPAGKNAEPSAESTDLNPAGATETSGLKPRRREVKTPAPPGETAGKTILPAAGIRLASCSSSSSSSNNNNNNVETNFNLKQKQHQVNSTPELSGRPAAARVVTQSSEKTELKTPSLPEPPVRDQCTKVAQQRVAFGPLPGITPVVPAVRETSHQAPVPETLRGSEACVRPEGLHQGPPLHHVSLHPQVAPRRFRHRQSYKSAVSYDEDEEEEEEVTVRRGSAGGVWPLSDPLRDAGRAISASSPCITELPAPPSVISSSFSPSSERNPPNIYIQGVEGETLPPHDPGFGSELGLKGQWAGTGLEPVSVSSELISTRHSRPLDAERYTPPRDRAKEASPHRDIHQDRQCPQAPGVQLEPRQGPHHSQRAWLSSSHSSLFSPSSDAGFSSSDWPTSGLSRGSRWNSSQEELQARTGGRRAKIQEVLQRAQRTKLESVTHLADSKTTAGRLRQDQHPTTHLSPFHHSADNLNDDQHSTVPVLPFHLSSGDLYDNREEAKSSEGSTPSPLLRQHPAVTRRLSSQLRSRMCRSLGADLDQLLQEEVRGRGGSEVARLNRLHLISSSLSLNYNLSSSSLSSCSTPPRCDSFPNLVEGGGQSGGRRSLPASAASSTAHHEGSSRQSLVPLEPREHAWLVKGAEGAWPDIYSLFREESSLLNKRDFISGFTVLHWIAKHGDHRVLNTLWYGVQKAGLMFDINARSTCGHTPLHIAAIHGNKNIMRLLVTKFNADVRLRDTAGKKPWQYLSCTVPLDIFQLLGAPARAALGGGGGVRRVETSWEQKQQQQYRRRRRHHLSSASSGERPLTIAGTTRVKRSSSIAAFLKHKSLRRFHGHQSDSSV
ncbi:ankyrin repeat domain-containing protein SOWAHB-like isoform X2 [Xiphias gladius]|uniref:ankyrin repeat domain-containing protein SOWAHB-like isoform X2 n=1 Tax=Xiphias gladius TaxID=8245 RepID=UPI001A98D57C|nr:ankyrin repeat domain-containing protein SOWAHB-like isoform X2 [Xiphias gladius]